MIRRPPRSTPFPTRRSSDLPARCATGPGVCDGLYWPVADAGPALHLRGRQTQRAARRSEEHTSELQSPCNLVCRLLLEKKKNLPLLTHSVRVDVILLD